MNILMLNASPKRKGGASGCFSWLLTLMLAGCKITTLNIRNQADYAEALALLGSVDAVVISSPLYVDGIPAHMLPFMEKAEYECKQKHYRFKLYVLSNSGFVEGVQNKLHLNMYEAWCYRAGIEWGGGLGIGGGTILHVLLILFPISVIIRCLELAVVFFSTGAITGRDLWSYFSGLLVTIFFFLGVLVCEAIVAHAIRRGKQTKNLYTRVLMPSFIFLLGADAFMFLLALFKGTLPHALFRKVSQEEINKNAVACRTEISHGGTSNDQQDS